MQRSYRDLKVWQASMLLAESIYQLTSRFPKSEVYGMSSRMRRASVSVAANIAEGYGRDNDGSFVQFLRVSQGSLKELETHLLLSQRVGLASSQDIERPIASCDEIGRMLRALVNSIERRRKAAAWMTSSYALSTTHYALFRGRSHG